uniref:Reverse transcriptase domain-containing protein n=1 Tax=Latimeria chalumnae TaxID=7897 RepID=H3AYE9_LATCH
IKNRNKPAIDAGNYRPITCLPITWKLLTAILARAISRHLETNKIMACEQKGNCRNTRGTKDQLLIDKTILRDCKVQKINLAICWIDYRKAFDSVLHSWILECLRMYKVNERIMKFMERAMKLWKTSLIWNNHHMGKVEIKRGIFQGDVISPLLFCIVMNPISYLLNNAKMGYKMKNGEQVSHLKYMDDLKLYGKLEKELDCLLHTTRIFSEDIKMEFGMEKCATVVMKRGKLTESKGMHLSSGQNRHLEEGEAYKYLGVLELDNIQHKMNEKIKAKYNRRVRKILKSKLSGENMIRAINQYAVPVIGYTAGIVDWTQELDRKTRKQMNIHGMVHPRADTDKLYVKRKEGGRGLRSIEDMINIEKLALRDYVNSRTEIVRSTERCQEYKRNKKNSRYSSWKQKALHGQYIWQLGEDANIEQTLQWLTKGHLKGETEALVIAAQDQALNTNSHRVRILHSETESKCRMCKAKEETVAYRSGCKMLANGSYKERHNNIARSIHWTLCKKANVEVTNQWWKHEPTIVEEKMGVKILWDFGIRTKREVQAHRSDIIFVDKTDRKAKIIDIACPIDYNIGEKEQEKIMKYQDLKMEIEKLWKVRVEMIPVVIGALGEVTKKHKDYIKKIDESIQLEDLQKAALLGRARIVWNVLQLPN